MSVHALLFCTLSTESTVLQRTCRLYLNKRMKSTSPIICLKDRGPSLHLSTQVNLINFPRRNIVCTGNLFLLQVYSPQGKYQKTITLKSEFEGLLHAVRLRAASEAGLLVCHGISDTKHRVCVLTSGGKKIKNIFGDKKGSDDDHVNNPSHVTVEYAEDRKCFRRVFVADELNDRVLVLDNKLVLMTMIPYVVRPHRLCYIEEKQLLVVASNEKAKLFRCS